MNWKKIFENWSLFAIIAGAVSFLIAWLLTNIKLLQNLPTVTFAVQDVNVRQQIASGISPSWGQGLLNFFSGYIPITLMGFLAVLITAFIVIMLGRILYEFLSFGIKDKLGRLLLVFAYAGAIFVAGSVWLFKLPLDLAVLATIIYYVVLALAMYGLSTLGIKPLEIPE